MFGNLALSVIVLTLTMPFVQAQRKQPSQSNQTPLTAKQIAHRVLPSVVLVETPCGLGRVIFGSGFVIDEGLVATNKHVVECGNESYVTLVSQDTKHRVIAKYLDSANDLAILKAEGLKAPALPLSDAQNLYTGDKVYAAGNPKGLEGTFSDGIISSLRYSAGRIQFTAAISPGSSGGPVVDEYGRVIGVTVSYLEGGQNLNFAVPTFFLLRLVADVRSGKVDEELAVKSPMTATTRRSTADQTPGISERQPPPGSGKPMPGAKSSPLDGLSKLVLKPDAQPVTSPTVTTTPHKCPLLSAQLLPLRGFGLGMSLNDVIRRFQGGTPLVSQPNGSGVRSMEVSFSRSQDPRGSTGLDRLALKFLDDRLYQIEATYSIGREWNKRPMSEFAGALSRGLGVDAAWTERVSKEFVIDCGEVRLNLSIDEFDDITPASARLPLAIALFTITDTTAEVQIKERAGRLRQQERQRDAERRQVFRP